MCLYRNIHLRTHAIVGVRGSTEISKVMFRRVCGFRVRVWESYRTSRSFGYGYASVTELTEVPGIVARACRTHRSFGRGQKMLYPYPGYCGTGRTELTRRMSYRTHRNSLYGYGCCTELTEVPGTGNTQANTRPRGRSSIGSGAFHPTCMACSHWVSVPEAIRSCVGIIDNHHRRDKS